MNQADSLQIAEVVFFFLFSVCRKRAHKSLFRMKSCFMWPLAEFWLHTYSTEAAIVSLAELSYAGRKKKRKKKKEKNYSFFS